MEGAPEGGRRAGVGIDKSRVVAVREEAARHQPEGEGGLAAAGRAGDDEGGRDVGGEQRGGVEVEAVATTGDRVGDELPLEREQCVGEALRPVCGAPRTGNPPRFPDTAEFVGDDTRRIGMRRDGELAEDRPYQPGRCRFGNIHGDGVAMDIVDRGHPPAPRPCSPGGPSRRYRSFAGQHPAHPEIAENGGDVVQDRRDTGE